MDTFTIGQVAERTGFSASALRYYEGLGLVSPATRTEAGYRVYDGDALSRLAFIARAKQLGCSLDEITDLLGIWDGERCGPVQRRFHELVSEKIRVTQRQIAELTAFGAQLQAAATRLDTEPVDGPCDDDCACFSDAGATPNEQLIACTLEPDVMPERMAQWQDMLAVARTRSATPDGRLRVEFGDGVAFGTLAALVAAEQQCCSFFAFTLTIDARGIALEVGAPEAAAEIVDAVFGKPAVGAAVSC